MAQLTLSHYHIIKYMFMEEKLAARGQKYMDYLFTCLYC